MASTILALTPAFAVVARGGDSSTLATSVSAVLLGLAVAWPFLAGARLLVLPPPARPRHAFARTLPLELFAGGIFALAYLLATEGAISGNSAWATYWVACAAVWANLSYALLMRR